MLLAFVSNGLASQKERRGGGGGGRSCLRSGVGKFQYRDLRPCNQWMAMSKTAASASTFIFM